MVWPPVVEPTGGTCKQATIRYGGQSVARTIRKVVHPCWTIRGVDNPQVGKTTIHHNNDDDEDDDNDNNDDRMMIMMMTRTTG